jgi:hypothetical protein
MGGNLTETVTIRGIKFASKKNISRYPSGKLLSGYLVDKTNINRLYFSSNSSIRFFDSGNVHSGTLAEVTKIGDIKYNADSEITLDEQGKVVTGILGEDIQITDKTRSSIPLYYASGRSISFKSDKVISGTLAHQISAWDMELPRLTEVRFYPSGNLAYIFNDTSTESVEKYQIKYKLSSGISFHENGRVLSGTVAESTVIDGRTIIRGNILVLDETGRVEKVN